MASFNDIAAQITPPALVELYALRDRAGKTGYYNTGRDVITFRGNVYQPATITRSAIKEDDSLSQRSITITVPITPILTNYLGQNSAHAEISIFRLFPDDPTEVIPIFYGTVSDNIQIDINTKTVSAKCVSASLILDKEIPSLVYSAMCQNVLFDRRCGLNAAAFTVTASIIGISANVLISPNFAGKPQNWFCNGYASFGSETRMIIASKDNTITLLSPFSGALVFGSKIIAYAGCDGTPQTCRDKFNNLRPPGPFGFNGCPYIPTRNPVIWGFK